MAGKVRHAALLRGINVGGKNKLPMKELRAIFERSGCEDVRTYIQSGNVVFRAGGALARRLPDEIPRAIAEQFRLEVPVIVRTVGELRSVARDNPFLRRGIATDTLHVAFLAKKPRAAAVEALDPDRSPPDEFRVAGREIYLRLPGGVARTKLSNAYFDSKLGTVSTMRNWRTVLKLIELADGL